MFEFYNNLELPKESQGELIVWLKGTYFKVKPEALAQWFVCDNKGLLNVPTDFDAQTN